MALLERWQALGARARRAALLALVGLAGCAIFGTLQPEEKPFAFPHKVHVEGQGLGCADCHSKVEMGDDPGMPSAAQCALCHSTIDAPKPADKRIDQLFENGKLKRRVRAKLPDETIFTHQQHAARDGECLSCHAAVAQDRQPRGPGLLQRMDDCTKCHAASKGPSDCAVCHKEIRKELRPANHGADWTREHGRVMRAHNEAVVAERCDTCHTRASCLDCHKIQAPENHTQYWRRRAHGLEASMDRRRCSACHEPESCTACHSQTTPLNHSGSWGAPLDRHCLNCHEPLRLEANCQVCHKATPSHALATPMPSWHQPSMNCRQCHGNGQPLQHADNGMSCTQCHH